MSTTRLMRGASPALKAIMPILHPNCSPPRRRAVATRRDRSGTDVADSGILPLPADAASVATSRNGWLEVAQREVCLNDWTRYLIRSVHEFERQRALLILQAFCSGKFK